MNLPEIRFAQVKRTQSDLVKFLELHNVLFKGGNISFEWLDWYLTIGDMNCPGQQETRIYGAWDGDSLIGMWCVEPKTLIINEGRGSWVGRCFSVGIHPDYRRQNLFVRLSTHAIECERSLRQYEHILGFPQQGKPVIEAHLKSGWKKVQDIEMNSFRPNTDMLPATSLQHVKRVVDFESLKIGQIHRGGFLEYPSYRNAKWLQHPDNSYICLSHGFGYIVLKPYADVCHVLDIQGKPENVTALLEAAKTLTYRHRWKELTIWCAENEFYRDEIKACGFVPGAEHGLSIELLAVNIGVKDPLRLERCHLQMGSEEGY